ncbi:hypothetical protein B0H12DRAFT_1112310, partial [Mycena haematopus]
MCEISVQVHSDAIFKHRAEKSPKFGAHWYMNVVFVVAHDERPSFLVVCQGCDRC